MIGKAWTKRSRPPSGYLTRTDAEEDLRRFLEREGARLTAAGGVSFGTVADAYVANLEARIGAGDFRASTLRSYRNIIDRTSAPSGASGHSARSRARRWPPPERASPDEAWPPGR